MAQARRGSVLRGWNDNNGGGAMKRMGLRRRTGVALAAYALMLGWTGVTAGMAQTKPIKIGVLNDLSGVYADYQGQGSVIAAQMAVEDFGPVNGVNAQVVFGDHQNKPDIGLAIARAWFDQDGVDVVADVPNSSIALAVADLVRQKNKVFIGSGAGTAALTGEKCSPNTVHWTYDTWEAGHALGRAVVAHGGKRWFFFVADYAFGTALESSTAEAVRAAGGTVVGSVRHPLGTTDFSTYLVEAQASGADVLGLANAGDDTVTALKQAREFGLAGRMQFAGPIVNINVIKPIGLANAQGVLAVMPFYWDHDEGSRAFAKRFAARHPRHIMPNDMQAGVYAGVLHYLKAVKQLGAAEDGRAVVAEMKVIPTEDPLFGKGVIRADGRTMHPVYLMQTKTPAESHGEWDMFKLVSTIPAEQAFRPLAEGHCPLVKP